MPSFEQLISDPFAAKRYLAILEPYDPTSGATLALHLADRPFTSEPDDDPPDTHFEPRLASALNFERHLFAGGRIEGRSIPGFGSLEINNADGGLDGWQRLGFDGRRIRLLLGGDGFRLADHRVVFDGTAEQIEFDDALIRVRLRDLQVHFERPLQQSVYAGTGGSEGGESLKGRPKPVTFGRCHHVEPVLVDAATLLYQVHDGPIEDIPAAFDMGIALIRTAGPPAAGEYRVDAAAGTLTLGAAPAGTVTAHVLGDSTGGVYVEDAAGLIARIARERAGIEDRDDDAFAAIALAAPAAVGLHAADGPDLIAALDRLAGSIGGHFGFDRSGRLTIGRLVAPAGPVAAEFGPAEILEIEREATPLPIWRQRIGYRRYWRCLSDGGVAAGIAPEERADLARDLRYETAETPAIRARHPLAGDEARETLLANGADAAAEAARRLALFGTARDLFKVRVKTQPYTLDLGLAVRLTYPRYGLAAGRVLAIVGMVEDSAVNEITLSLWG